LQHGFRRSNSLNGPDVMDEYGDTMRVVSNSNV